MATCCTISLDTKRLKGKKVIHTSNQVTGVFDIFYISRFSVYEQIITKTKIFPL